MNNEQLDNNIQNNNQIPNMENFADMSSATNNVPNDSQIPSPDALQGPIQSDPLNLAQIQSVPTVEQPVVQDNIASEPSQIIAQPVQPDLINVEQPQSVVQGINLNPEASQTTVQPVPVVPMEQMQAVPTVEQSNQNFIAETQAISSEKPTGEKRKTNYVFVIILLIAVFLSMYFLFPLLKNYI